jgi:hypothetical protein
MQHKAIHATLLALLSGLMLSACGPATGFELAPSEEPLGTAESAMCSGTSVGVFTLKNVSSYLGEVVALGNWEVVYPTNGVHLEYFIDGVWQATENDPGTYDSSTGKRVGSWHFSRMGISCGAHTFEVRAWPKVYDSTGKEVTCGPTPSKTVSQAFTDDSCKCTIAGKTYLNGRVNPSSACQICDVSQSRTSWSFNPSGYAVTTGYCKQLVTGRRYCVNSGVKNNMACMDNTDCYMTCGEML